MRHNCLKMGTDDIGSKVQPTSSLFWADVILADFQRVISLNMQHITTYFPCTPQRVLRTKLIKKSKPKYACLPSKIVEVWIDWFCVHYNWWRWLQLTSSVFPVWLIINCISSKHWNLLEVGCQARKSHNIMISFDIKFYTNKPHT